MTKPDLSKISITRGEVAGLVEGVMAAAAKLSTDLTPMIDISRYGFECRRRMVRNYLRAHCPETVLSGPFQGMRISAVSGGSLFGPRILGCYEEELHGLVRDSGRYRRLVNVGCAEGWYAVGFARLYPALEVVAYDIEPGARALCAEIAEVNGVRDRIDIRAEFDAAEMAAWDAPGTVVWMDIEGAEVPLLASLGGLGLRCDWVIETHKLPDGGCSLEPIRRHFADTHDVTVIEQTPRSFLDYEVLRPLGQLDRFLAQWEGRGAEPWVALTRKRPAAGEVGSAPL